MIDLRRSILSLAHADRGRNCLSRCLALLRADEALSIESVRANEVATASILAKEALVATERAAGLVGLSGVGVESAGLGVAELLRATKWV